MKKNMYGRSGGKMARRAVYTPGSVDSWDMENLNFLRKMSEARKLEESDQETLSYVSDSEEDIVVYEKRSGGGREDESESDYGSNRTNTPQRLLDEALYSGGNGFALLNKSIVMKQMKTMAQSSIKDAFLDGGDKPDVISPLPLIHNKCGGSAAPLQSQFDRRFMKGGRKPKGSLVTLGFMEPQLEDCYVLDVVTVRNESVLAECGVNEPRSTLVSEGDGSSNGMASALRRDIVHGSSAGESENESVSSDEFNSAREGFFPSSSVEDDDEPITIHRRDSSEEDINSSSECEAGISPVSVVVRGECATRLPAAGYPQSSERSFETASSNYYYLGQQQAEEHEHHASERHQHQRESSSLMTVETPRSISPYYVRLRRDLIPPSYTPPHPRQPWNFGMNRQGLLVIDYSPNWDGLETYMRNLSLG